MSISLSGLDDFHANELKKYMRFSTSKRKEHIDEIEGAFDDTKDMKMLDGMYSQADAKRILVDIRESVKPVYKRELELYGRMTALYFQMTFEKAERKGISMKVDLSKLDAAVKLSGVEKVLALGSGVELSGRKLQSMGGGGVDVKMVEQAKDLEHKNDKLQRDFEDTTERIKRELKANVNLKNSIISLKQQIKDAKRDFDNAKHNDKTALTRDREDLEDDISAEKKNNDEAALEKELKQIKEELGGRIQDSTKFKQLKEMIKAKNEQLKEMRGKR